MRHPLDFVREVRMLRRCQIAVILACLLLCSSCVVPPLPLTHRTEAPNGAKLPDLGFIQPGVTTRDQVEQNFKSLDTGATPGMFWGRFNHSVMSDPGGSRYWGRENLLITYDDHGLVKTSRRVGDDHINLILRDWLVSRKTQQIFSPEVRIAATSLRSTSTMIAPGVAAELVLGSNDFAVIERGDGAKAALHVSPAKIKRIQATSPNLCCTDKARANSEIVERIWIDGGESKSHPFLVQLSPANLVVFIDYIRHHCPNVKYQ